MNTFNPETNYTWGVDDIFEVTGKEFELLHNTLAQVFQNMPVAQSYVMLHQLLGITTSVLKRNVEEGKIKELEKDSELHVADV